MLQKICDHKSRYGVHRRFLTFVAIYKKQQQKTKTTTTKQLTPNQEGMCPARKIIPNQNLEVESTINM